MSKEVDQLVLAAQKGCATTINELVADFPNIIELADSRSRKALHVAAHQGRTDMILLLVAKGANVNGIDCFGRTALHCAAQNNKQSAVEALVGLGAWLEVADSRGRTALFAAAVIGLASMVEHLASKGASVEVADTKKRTPLLATIKNGSIKTFKALLLIGASTKVKDAYGQSALANAVMRGQLAMIRAISEGSGGGRENIDSELLFIAVQVGQVGTLRFLHEELGLKLSTQDRFGRWLLNVAVRRRRAEVVTYLANKGMDCDEIIGSRCHQFSLLQYAAKSNYDDVIEALCKAGAKINGLLDSKQLESDAAILTACKYGRLEALRKLVWLGASLKVRSVVDSKSALSCCYLRPDCLQESHPCVLLLLELGVKVDTPNNRGQTALHLASASSFVKGVEALLAAGANTELRDGKGSRPLHLACSPHQYFSYYLGCDRAASTTALLEHGAEVHVLDDQKCSPLCLAKRYHTILADCITVLAQHGAI